MYYILTIDNKAHETIPELSPDFPGVPIEQRYPPELLNKCVKSDVPVPQGWLYDPETQTFSAPPEPEPVDPPVDPPTEPPSPDALKELQDEIDHLMRDVNDLGDAFDLILEVLS